MRFLTLGPPGPGRHGALHPSERVDGLLRVLLQDLEARQRQLVHPRRTELLGQGLAVLLRGFALTGARLERSIKLKNNNDSKAGARR